MEELIISRQRLRTFFVLGLCIQSTAGLTTQPHMHIQGLLRTPRTSGSVLMGSPVYPTPFSSKQYLEQTQKGKATLVKKWIDAGVPRWVTLIDEILFLVGSIMFVIGSLDFYPGVPIAKYIEGCELFVVGSLLFLGLAIFASYEITVDAGLEGREPEAALLAEQALYILGSTLFAVGTILFTPPLSPDIPTAQAAVEQADNAIKVFDVTWFGKVYEVTAASATSFELSESAVKTGDLLFAIGSVLYAIAAFVSALRAAGESTPTGSSADDKRIAALRRRAAVSTASLYELGGVCFVVGTLGFIPSGVLGISACPDGSRNMMEFGALLFVLGSLLYTAGSAVTLGVVAWITYTDDALVPAPTTVEMEDDDGGDVDGGSEQAADEEDMPPDLGRDSA